LEKFSRFATRVGLSCVLVVLSVSAAHAQSPYVGGSLAGDIVRLSGSSDFGSTGSGEALGGALRVGTPLGERWGVDLEFARTGEIETEPDIRILADAFPTIGPGILIFPQPEITTRRQASTLTTMLWWQHAVSDRFDLVYLGGAAFTRSDSRLTIEFPSIPIPTPIGDVPLPSRVLDQESVSYSTGVGVGLDGRIWMTERLRLVSGLRLLTIPGGWVVRPAVGVQWVF
jgi:hypothetical protein